MKISRKDAVKPLVLKNPRPSNKEENGVVLSSQSKPKKLLKKSLTII